MTIVTVGIDLAKNVFAVHGVDETGQPVLVRRRGYWKAVVAIAAKNARMCWAMLQRGDAFKLPA